MPGVDERVKPICRGCVGSLVLGGGQLWLTSGKGARDILPGGRSPTTETRTSAQRITCLCPHRRRIQLRVACPRASTRLGKGLSESHLGVTKNRKNGDQHAWTCDWHSVTAAPTRRCSHNRDGDKSVGDPCQCEF